MNIFISFLYTLLGDHMINKKNIWFLTLFSLVLVLSVYYITMPSDIPLETSYIPNANIEEESENATLVALRVSKEEKVLNELEILNGILTDASKSTIEKNEAYDKMKNINDIKGEEDKLEKKLKSSLGINSCITIEGDKISVVASRDKHDANLANDIMRTIQENYDKKMYVSVKFE